jgi:hypothetical protein
MDKIQKAKKAVIGEIRYWNGGKDAWVKHPDGWVHVHKNGNHKFEPAGSGGKYVKAETHHLEFAKPYLERHLREKESEEESNKEGVLKPQNLLLKPQL